LAELSLFEERFKVLSFNFFTMLVPLRKRYLLAHPNDRALRFRTQITSTLPYTCSNDSGDSQHTSRLSGGNARDRMSFGRSLNGTSIYK